MSDDEIEVAKAPLGSPENSADGYGFFCKVPDVSHFKRIEDKIRQQGYFTDRVLFDSVTVRLSDLVLVLSPKDILAYAAHVRPARNSTTGTRAFRAESLVELNITEAELEAEISDIYWETLRQAFDSPSYRPKEPEWKALWEAIKRLRPDQAQALRRLEQLRFDAVFEVDGDGQGIQHFFEKDAVGVALDIAGIPFHGVFAELSDGLSSDKSLLQSLCGNTTEDVHIDHDVRNFPGFIRSEDILHAVRLIKGRKTITIYNVNRRPAETADFGVGVDLIYRNAFYGSYTFVQYKMLDPKGKDIQKKWIFRPNPQFSKEISKMQRAYADLVDSEISLSAKQYRLGKDPFFFKFCRRQYLKVNAGQLAHGHYITLSHLDLVLDESRGARGGVIVSLDTMERWITRTAFTYPQSSYPLQSGVMKAVSRRVILQTARFLPEMIIK